MSEAKAGVPGEEPRASLPLVPRFASGAALLAVLFAAASVAWLLGRIALFRAAEETGWPPGTVPLDDDHYTACAWRVYLALLAASLLDGVGFLDFRRTCSPSFEEYMHATSRPGTLIWRILYPLLGISAWIVAFVGLGFWMVAWYLLRDFRLG